VREIFHIVPKNFAPCMCVEMDVGDLDNGAI